MHIEAVWNCFVSLPDAGVLLRDSDYCGPDGGGPIESVDCVISVCVLHGPVYDNPKQACNQVVCPEALHSV